MMKCEVCQVTVNSSVQFQQHLLGQGHAKKVKQQEQQQQGNQPHSHGHSQGQGQGQAQIQRPKQNSGRGRAGRPIRGLGGRGRGTAYIGVVGMGRGRGGGMQSADWTQHNAQQQRMPFPPGQLPHPPAANFQPPPPMPFPGPLPGLEPLVMNALNLTAQALQSANMALGSNENNQSFGNQMFGHPPPYGNNNLSLGKKQGVGNRNFPGNRGLNWRPAKAQRPKQPPPPPRRKAKSPPGLKEAEVFGDNMGVVSVTLENQNQLYCDICCVTMTSPDQAYSHYRGAKHIKKARVARLHEVGALAEDNERADSGECYCSYCNITVNSADQMKVHQDGARHKKMVEQRKRKCGEPMDTEPCEKKASHPEQCTDFVMTAGDGM